VNDDSILKFNACRAVPEVVTPVETETSEYGAGSPLTKRKALRSSWQNGTIRVRQCEY
jgi:hypothetical protein